MIDKSVSSSPDDIYQGLFTDSQVPMLLILAETGEIIKANKAALRFYGYSAAQIIQLKINDINQLTPEQVQLEIERAKNLHRNHFVFKHSLANGDIKNVSVYSSPVVFNNRKLLCSIIHDITARTQAENQLNIYAQLFTSSNDMLAVIDSEYTYLAANHHYLEMLMKSDVEVIGKSVKEVLGERNFHSYCSYMKRAMNGEFVLYERQFITPNNFKMEIEIRYFPFIKDDVQAGIVGVFRNISEKKQTSEKLAYLAHHDILTDLPNRLLLQERLEQHTHRAQRLGNLVYVVFIDLDRFKSINDSFGHSVGDALLVSVADRLKKIIRISDTVARISGDEFIVIFETSEKPFEIIQALNRLLKAFNTPFNVENHSLSVTSSIGVSQYPGDSDKPSQLISNADIAMYHAKQQGRNQFSFFSKDKADQIKRQNQIENALRGALKRNEFELFFQPQVSLPERKCIGFEVLLRWCHSELGYISPAVFIPIAEQMGIMWELGSWVLRQSCEQGKQWLDLGINFGKLAVNISGVQLKHSNFCGDTKKILSQTGFNPGNLEIEITESFVMNQVEDSISQLWILRELGVDIAIDDFGTGYSSLSYLKRLPINKLKIDRSFISDIDKDDDSMIITKSIIALAQAMHLQVIAEGIEESCQADILISLGCKQVQGFLYSKTMPAKDVTFWLKKYSEYSLENCPLAFS